MSGERVVGDGEYVPVTYVAPGRLPKRSSARPTEARSVRMRIVARPVGVEPLELCLPDAKSVEAWLSSAMHGYWFSVVSAAGATRMAIIIMK
eukprot:CAMPEP_0174873360 /NCGR_PEP_ID=MMETSP1114-20130205/74766_1 /TAXON_ID=312471 /ORGANISM="Neobodo designis, Strain CCAP 1951/1" /LENGTH=91 /DNA_ID=CAMNT_0016108675 /DNA_START=418 /DNA_END=693 /DNA_ORIENTATION=+